MKYRKWYLTIIAALILSSALIYSFQIMIFHKSEDTFFYMLQDLSFVPIQVLLVTLFLDRLMKKRERESFLNKLNMIIGVFYNDIGMDLIKTCNRVIEDREEIKNNLAITAKWTDKDFQNAKKNIRLTPKQLNLDQENLNSINSLLLKKQNGLLSLLANPNLLEHQSFTDLLWAVFHLSDELSHRENFKDLPSTDLDHLKVDVHRAYMLVIMEWISYMKHLKKDYPYLFSVAVRKNPFDPAANIVIKNNVTDSVNATTAA